MAHIVPLLAGSFPMMPVLAGALTTLGRGREPCFAAIDLGSNNCRLLIARRTPGNGSFTVVDSFSRVIRLAEGLGNGSDGPTNGPTNGHADGQHVDGQGALAPAAIDRALSALAVCRDKVRRHPVIGIRAVATDACRRAVNRDAFLERVRHDTGFALDIISAAEEASLALAGCAPLLNNGPSHALVLDVGGGSSELMWVEMAGGHPRLLDFVSLPVGVVGLAEKFPAPSSFEDMVAQSARELGAFEARNGIAALVRQGRVGFVGTSGTATTIAALHLGLATYDRSRVDGLEMTIDDVRAIVARVLAMPPESLGDDPRIGRSRAAFVVPGIAILEAVLRAWPVPRIRVADRGVREGILFQLMAEAPHVLPSGALQSGIAP
ncbi:MAG TPA: Ppx/GppA phosphatase family protein [Alphaproteobacteria bacterium]|nr:Ppx/GppA phosphatase family protein [Alphaproteobacteria bacterium]